MALLRTVSPLVLRYQGEASVTFDNRELDREHLGSHDPMLYRYLAMPVSVWREMGEPKVITMTIEPGDALNDPPAGA